MTKTDNSQTVKILTDIHMYFIQDTNEKYYKNMILILKRKFRGKPYVKTPLLKKFNWNNWKHWQTAKILTENWQMASILIFMSARGLIAPTDDFQPFNPFTPRVKPCVDKCCCSDHSNESKLYWAVLSSSAVYFWQFCKMKFMIFSSVLNLALFEVKGLINRDMTNDLKKTFDFRLFTEHSPSWQKHNKSVAIGDYIENSESSSSFQFVARTEKQIAQAN